jgi:hypothetical protein
MTEFDAKRAGDLLKKLDTVIEEANGIREKLQGEMARRARDRSNEAMDTSLAKKSRPATRRSRRDTGT